MQKLTSLLAVILMMSSCGSADDQPMTETQLIAGALEQANVQYFPIGTNYLFNDVTPGENHLLSYLEIDLDGNGLNDLKFELASGLESDIQLLMVKSINNTEIAESIQKFELATAKPGYLQLIKEGTLLRPEFQNWKKDEWLFLHYYQAFDWESAGPVLEQSSLIPIQIEGQPGWVELQLLTDASKQTVWGLNVKQMALKSN